MCDYEDKILARQEQIEILEEIWSTFPHNLNEDNLCDALHAEAMRSEVWNNVRPAQTKIAMTEEQFIACVNYSDSGYQGFDSLSEILGYIMYLEKERKEYLCNMEQIKKLCEAIKTI